MEYLPYILDGIIILIPVAALIIGRHRGFARTVLPLAVTLAAMIFCRIYAGNVARQIDKDMIHTRLSGYISDEITEKTDEGISQISEALPSVLRSAAAEAGYSSLTAATASAAETAGESIASSAESLLIIPLITAIIYAVMYVLSKAAGRLLAKPADLIAKLPLIKQANNFLGAVTGLLQGLIIIALAVIAVSVLSAFLQGTAFTDTIEKTTILQFLADKIKLLF